MRTARDNVLVRLFCSFLSLLFLVGFSIIQTYAAVPSIRTAPLR